jgi:hypothetical protein
MAPASILIRGRAAPGGAAPGRRRRIGVVLAGVVVAGGLTACGGSGSTTTSPAGSSTTAAAASTPPPITTLITRATGLKIASLSFSLSTSVPAAGSTPASTLTGTATLRLRPALAGTIDFTTRGRSIDELIVGQTIYINLPQVGARDGGRPWVAVDLSAASSAAGIDLGALLQQIKSLNPSATLQLLAARQRFHETGVTTVDGQRVVGLTGTFTPATLNAPGFSRAIVAQLRAKLASVGATRETVTAYLTFTGLPVRTVTSLTTKTYGVLDDTIDIRGINAPVTVGPPPPAKTISLAQANKLPA